MNSVPNNFVRESWPVYYEGLPEETKEAFFKLSIEGYKALVKQQFQLCYIAHISIEDSDRMSHPELVLFYQAMIEQNQTEKEALEKSSKKKR